MPLSSERKKMGFSVGVTRQRGGGDDTQIEASTQSVRTPMNRNTADPAVFGALPAQNTADPAVFGASPAQNTADRAVFGALPRTEHR